jgi:hypothetical protein
MIYKLTLNGKVFTKIRIPSLRERYVLAVLPPSLDMMLAPNTLEQTT